MARGMSPAAPDRGTCRRASGIGTATLVIQALARQRGLVRIVAAPNAAASGVDGIGGEQRTDVEALSSGTGLWCAGDVNISDYDVFLFDQGTVREGEIPRDYRIASQPMIERVGGGGILIVFPQRKPCSGYPIHRARGSSQASA